MPPRYLPAVVFCVFILSCGSGPVLKAPRVVQSNQTEKAGYGGAAAGEGRVPEGDVGRTGQYERVVKEVRKNKNIRKELAACGGAEGGGPGDKYCLSANVGGYKVVYDLKNAVAADGARYIVPFSMEGAGKSGGAAREGCGETEGLTLNWKIEEDNAGILLSFDDDYFESWEGAFPLFDRYGVRVTFFVRGRPNRFCARAAGRGHEIAYHTKSHRDLRKLDRRLWREETLGELLYYKEEGIEVGAFAYPFGFYERWMNSGLEKVFRFLRGFGTSLVFYSRGNPGGAFLKSKSLDNIVFKDDSRFYEEITLILRMLKFAGGDTVALFTTHDISGGADWGIKPERLEFLLKEAKTLKLNFLTFRELGPPRP